MIKSKIVFIIGAGASQEAGLPTGADFKKLIAEKLDIRFKDGFTRTSGDYQIENTIREHVKRLNPQHIDINPYLYAAWKIRDALPQALSIDNVLDAHTGDDKIELCGKLGIAKTILEAESVSRLNIKPGTKADYGGLENTWYAQFLKLVTENVRRSDLDNLFDNVSFITFNYDRCIEQYLIYALSSYYAISESESENIVNKLIIKHPYGQVGRLPLQDSINPVKFGQTTYIDLLHVASQLKTFTEQEADPSKLNNTHQLLVDASTVVFLGFAFHELNMQLLDPGVPTNISRVFATAKGLSNSDCSIVKEDIRLIIRPKIEPVITINSTLTCYQLFETYWRSLSR